MSEVTFNEEVTAAELNNLAVDLGMTEFSYFEDNMPYAVHKLNQITADLVSAGVLRTGANKELGCEVEALNGKAYVQAGVIVFESGAKIRITEPVEIEIIPGTIIYAFYDTTTGKASIETSETTPAGDYVLLAEVDTEGVLADRRSSCVSNVVLPADTPNTYREITAVFEYNSHPSEIDIDVGTSAFSYIFIKNGAKRYHSSGSPSYRWGPVLANAYHLIEGEEVIGYMGPYQNDADESLYITKQGQHLHVRVNGGTKGYIYTLNFVIM